ncbi:hypothetical protein CPB84DRAFT_96354 [Gymnopilus junonius]|uniref:Uncharacterized protein n=1 Tax=Gymnopilus junonius TaxID=109634 RepID=A0A9P5NWH0_GYMJU|nr:hypothetical protein CPB84DRAFT_96354 [Gymnopilus junonius]
MATLSANTQESFIIRTPTRPRMRTRTYSLISVSSGISPTSAFEISRVHSTSQIPNTQDAYGSFIPVRSAASSLKDFLSCYPSFSTHPPSPKKRRRVTFTFDNVSSSISSRNDPDIIQSSDSPYITRSSLAPLPSPTSSSSSSLHSTPNIGPDLHPILASLERHSRLCSQVIQCSTCGKAGADFPSCAKCGARWCSRPCRLVGGKRHIC